MLVKDCENIMSCRYAENIPYKYLEYILLADKSNNGWSGEVSFVAVDPKGKDYIQVDYSYGSCSGCDDWEARDLSDEQISEEIEECTLHLSLDEMKKYKKSFLDNYNPYSTQKEKDSCIEKKFYEIVKDIDPLKIPSSNYSPIVNNEFTTTIINKLHNLLIPNTKKTLDFEVCKALLISLNITQNIISQRKMPEIGYLLTSVEETIKALIIYLIKEIKQV